ncbi:MAG: hypothetical protein QXJ98_05005 [Archaeoglobaceae archaeon]
MFSYVIIIYIAFFVFIGIVYVIASTFLSTLAEAAMRVQSTGGSLAILKSVDVITYRNAFMHAAIFQGLFGGILAGVMGEGSVSAGVKHALIMVLIAYVGFSVMFGFRVI